MRSPCIKTFDHWIAFALLAFIGGKMLLECIPKKNAPATYGGGVDIRNIKTLLILAVATSIDALAVGISLSLSSSIMDTGTGIFLSAFVIGMITFVVCILGFEFGKRIGQVLERGAQAAGGIILIGIGVKILLEHLLS
ncbi:MAG: hypothetical protein Ta2A_19400 [Treponemataceae bacterium]|nr:MAG: hypothetical protein Ta2A_19400 [Treponemataceae bacterium]